MNKILRKKFYHSSLSIKAFIIFLIATTLAFMIPVKETPIDVGNVLSSTSIFYSILLGFYIAAAMGNLSRLKALVAAETGALISVYNSVRLVIPQKLDVTRNAIDKYLIKRFDYEIDNYTEPTRDDFFNIFNVLKGFNAKSDGERATIDYIAAAQYYVTQARREITIVGAKIVNRASWTVLNVLSFVVVVSLFLMRDGSMESAIVTAFLSASAVLALFILADVDGNRFGEEQFAVDTYQDVFIAIGNLQYYPDHYLEQGRYNPPVHKYRTGSSSAVRVVND